MQHANCVPSLAAGMKSLPSGSSSMADTQALWRFLNNPRVKPVDLSSPLLAMARELIEPQLADLKKYAVFSKSILTDDSANWVRFGLAGADAVLTRLGLELPAETDSVARANGLIAIRASQDRAELWAPVDQARQEIR